MGRYRKMLVALDGTEESLHALRESFKLAETEKSWITAVCVTPPYAGDLELVAIGDIRESVEQPCRKALTQAEELGRKEHLFIRTVHENGQFHERILDVAAEYNCELIVMGRRHRKQFERLIGSTTARVIGYSRCDVLVVPATASVGWKRLLVATDGSKFSEAAVDRAIDFALSYGGELKVLSVVDVPTELYGDAPDLVEKLIGKAKVIVEGAVKRAQEAGLKAEGFVREGHAPDVILEAAKYTEAETIVLASHGKTGIRRLLMGSVTEHVVGFANCPLLVVSV